MLNQTSIYISLLSFCFCRFGMLPSSLLMNQSNHLMSLICWQDMRMMSIMCNLGLSVWSFSAAENSSP